MYRKLSRNLLFFVLVVSLSFFLNACAKKVVQEEALPMEEPQVSEPMESEEEMAAREAQLKKEELREQREIEEAALREEAFRKEEAARRETKLREAFENVDINFDFDQFFLRDDAREILAEKASWLLEHGDVTITAEGHCDERGTTEYNMALGERRANSAMKYLVNAGVRADRISTISYGEEMPLDPGDNEEAWAKNRRAHFVIFSE